MQQHESYARLNCQYSLSLAAGLPSYSRVEGGTDAIIPQTFGENPAAATTGSYPRPTGGNGGGGSTVVVVAGKLPLKFIILIVVGVLVVGGGILVCLCGCVAGCSIGIKEAITGKKPEVEEVPPEDLAPQAQKGEEEEALGTGASVARTGGLTYPTMAEHQPYVTYAPPSLPPPPPPEAAAVVQDDGLRYLFLDTPPDATRQSTPLTITETTAPLTLIPVYGNLPSPAVPRYSRLSV